MADWQKQLTELGTERVAGCLLCGQPGAQDARWQSFLELLPPYGVHACRTCGLRWLNPRPDADGYRALYSHELYFGGDATSPADYHNVVAGRLDYFRDRIARITRLSGARHPLDILDYGAATGEFVHLCHEAGHRATGIELSADARAAAQRNLGIELMDQGEVDAIPHGTYDAIHMNHVLEHMPDPRSHLEWCWHLLKPRGLLVIEVPQQFDNDLDRLRRLLRRGGKQARFDAYSLHHAYFFNPKTLRRLLERTRFTVVQMTTFNPAKAPLWPPSARNLALHALLRFVDWLHEGSNIIEVYAMRQPATTTPRQTACGPA